MANIVSELEQLYQRTFGTKPVVPKVLPNYTDGELYKTPAYVANGLYTGQQSRNGSSFQEYYLGVEIWLPTTLVASNGTRFYLPYSVIRISGSSSWVKTPLSERRGSVKELYSIDDYQINIKGFFIDKKERFFPSDDLAQLKKLHEAGESFTIENALTDIYLDATDKVVLESFDLPEMEGGKKHVRAFNMKLCSDSVFTLEYNGL